MSVSSIGLSSPGLERAASATGEAFVFSGNGWEFECTQFQAAFISPRVHSLIQQDRTVTSFWVEWRSQGVDEKQIFGFLERLMNGFEITPTVTDVNDLFGIAECLGNTELMSLIVELDWQIDLVNVCGRYLKKGRAGLLAEPEIECLASHFYELKLENLTGVDICMIEKIVSSHMLCLETEDSLLDFILSFDSESAVHLLVRYLHCEYLSCERMNMLLDRWSISDIDPFLWSSLCRRLGVSMVRVVGSLTQIDIPMDARNSFDGIISYLTKKHGGNVQEKEIITMTSKSGYRDPRSTSEFALKGIADLTSDSSFFSEQGPGQWICWDFCQMRVRLTHYAICTSALRSWVLEGSLDGAAWTVIDRQTDSWQLSQHGWPEAWFGISNPVE
jgi:hypothetical protein